jgi:L-threonylcarbamoyladenylate synthase
MENKRLLLMKTLYYKIDRDKPEPQILATAADIIRRGGLVAFPTETVYGLGANGLDAAAVSRIFEAKGRPSDNPLILHIADRRELDELVREVPEWLEPLLGKFWPGPFTVVLPRSPAVPDIVTAGLDTVAIRLPSLGAARELIRAAGVPIAAPSANLSGRPSPTTAAAVMADMDGRIEMVLDAGPCDVGLESTVLDCVSQPPAILRPGGVTQEMLEACLSQVRAAGRAPADEKSVPRAPGMKYRHYAPAAPLVLFPAGEGLLAEEVANRLLTALSAAILEGKKAGAIVSAEMAVLLPAGVTIAIYGSRRHPAETAAGLYEALRFFDTHPVDVIFAEGVREKGIGRALMNRLYKAASSVGEGR